MKLRPSLMAVNPGKTRGTRSFRAPLDAKKGTILKAGLLNSTGHVARLVTQPANVRGYVTKSKDRTPLQARGLAGRGA